MQRAALYVRVGFLLMGLLGTSVASDYVAQLRFVHIGFCPSGVMGNVPSLLVWDSLHAQALCFPLPQPPSDVLEPHLPPSDKKQGV